MLLKRKKNNDKNVSSIAIKINSSSVKNLFSMFLVLDICILIIVIFAWCIRSEMNYFGSFTPYAQRSFEYNSIENASYTVVLSNGKTMLKSASELLFILKNVIVCAVTVEAIFLLENIIFGTRRVRKLLKPLDDIAETASKLGDIEFNEEKFHSLEQAIDNVSPILNNDRIDIGDSELKGLEDAINKLLDRMRESYRQQARFVSDASHELRTPISVIQGYANMLDRWGKKDEKILDEAIDAIKSESQSMSDLIEQLLFLARGTNGKINLKKTTFILNDLMQEVYDEFKMIDDKHLYEYKELDTVEVNADMRLVKQTMRILVENSVKYTKEGERIILKIGYNNVGEAYFCVQDDGIGIDSDEVPHIFERFFRADSARTRSTGGTGLGLSIAKWIVDNHKGYFEVISRKGIGTRISVYF